MKLHPLPASRFSSYPPTKRRSGGFSLVEVTLALGIITFAATTMLALIPSGLNTLRSSMDQTVETEIMRQITARSIMSQYTDLEVADPGLLFNEQGQMTDNVSDARYKVLVSLAGSGAPVFPGSEAVGDWSSSAKRLAIKIIFRPGPGVDGSTTERSLLVANSGN